MCVPISAGCVFVCALCNTVWVPAFLGRIDQSDFFGLTLRG